MDEHLVVYDTHTQCSVSRCLDNICQPRSIKGVLARNSGTERIKTVPSSFMLALILSEYIHRYYLICKYQNQFAHDNKKILKVILPLMYIQLLKLTVMSMEI